MSNQIIRRIIGLRDNKLGMFGLLLTSIYFLVAILGPMISPYDPNQMNPGLQFSQPSPEFLMGTDRFGRDVLSRALVGARISLVVSLIVAVTASTAGVFFGVISSFYGGKVDEIIMRIVDIIFTFPHILLALVVVAILGPGLDKAIIALSIAYTPTMVRITRSSGLSIREEEYILAAKAYGEKPLSIMARDMFPNQLPPIIVQSTIILAYSILAEAALSYLGLSAQPPTPTLGVMISEGQSSLTIAPWISIFPGVLIMVYVMGLTFLGVGLRDTLDPKINPR